MSAAPNICHDYMEREGCSMIANPEHTLNAAEHGFPDAEDLHFCSHCKAERGRFVDEVVNCIAEGWFSDRDMLEAILNAQIAEGTLKS